MLFSSKAESTLRNLSIARLFMTSDDWGQLSSSPHPTGIATVLYRERRFFLTLNYIIRSSQSV